MLLAAATEADKLNLDISIAMWASLGVIIVVMLAFDLFIYARGHIPSVRENTIWSIGWIVVALAFGAVFWAWQGSAAGSQYLAGYLLERSLSLDNIFVFAVILAYFAVPGEKVQAQGAGLGHHARARPAPDLHPARRGAAGRLPHHVLRLRRAAALHGVEARPPRRRRDRARAQPGAQATAQAGDDDRRLRRRQAVHQGERQARGDAAARRLRRRSRRPTSSSPSTRSRRSSPSPRSRSSSSRPTRSR